MIYNEGRDLNEGIEPLIREPSADGFASALGIARSCSFAEPSFTIESNHGLTFSQARDTASQFRSTLISTTRDLEFARALIATLTSQDAALVTPLLAGDGNEIASLRNEIWSLSSIRGDYDALLAIDAEIAGIVGALIGSAEKGLAVVIDGLDAYAAALLAQRLAHRSMDRCLAAAPSTDPAIQEAQHRLRLPQILTAPVNKSAGLVAFRHLETMLSVS